MTQPKCNPPTPSDSKAFDINQIENRFTYHAPTPEQIEQYQTIRNYAKDFAHFINNTLPFSRDKSLALTKLDEVVFWANAAIARNTVN